MRSQESSRSPPDCRKHVGVLNGEFQSWITVFRKFLTRHRYSIAKPLDVTETLHHLGEVRVSIVGYSLASKVASCDLTEGSPRILNLDPISEPSDASRSVGSVVGAVHDGVSTELLKGYYRIIGVLDLQGPG